ncbi:rod-binding protein [Piscirickettsia salmonis]|uniref:rod-binding protein n=1 Tax=Piscirickettsia salmonis TaxID=1238 RepID=UPI0007C910B7|nr:Peptidoglycan hydrolase FlgJ [Piscirickettsiaceae bacterium NZ-RLO1]
MDAIPVQHVSNAFDFSAFQKLKANVNKAGEEDKTLRAVAEQFESIFIKMALDSMRKASKELESDLFKSSYQDFYQDLYDDQLSLNLANNGGIGLTDALVRYLSQQAGPEQVLNVNNTLKKEQSAQDGQTAFKRLIATLEPYLDDLSEKLGVSKKAMLSHAIVETGWGSANMMKRGHLSNSNQVNLFGSPQRFGLALSQGSGGGFLTVDEAVSHYDQFLEKYLNVNQRDNKVDPGKEKKIADEDFFKFIQSTLYPKEPEKLQQFLNVAKSSLLNGI